MCPPESKASSSASLSELERRVVELESLIETSQVLNSSLRLSSVLDSLLLTAMGRFLVTRGLIALDRGGQLRVESSKGIPLELRGKDLGVSCSVEGAVLLDEPGEAYSPCLETLRRWGFSLVLPLASGRRGLGLLALGPKPAGRRFEADEVVFLETLVRIAATAVENALIVEELDAANRRLDRKLQEMQTLFELSTELNASLDENRIASSLCYALMGEMLTNTCAVWQLLPGGQPRLLAAFGPLENHSSVACPEGLVDVVRAGRKPLVLSDAEPKPLAPLPEAGFRLLVPLWVQDRPCGAVALGARLDARDYSDDDLSFLVTLGNHAANALENARLFRESLEKQRMEEELQIAREIQLRLLPRGFPEVPGIEVFGTHKPSRWVAGDYFDVLLLSPEELALVVADVSGKGVPAALLMANVQAGLHTLLAPGVDLAGLAARLNRLIFENTGYDKFVTVFVGILSIPERSLRYVNAGHNPPYLLRPNGDLSTLETGGLLMGMIPEVGYEVGQANLAAGDLLFLYTDGVVEAQNVREEEFGEARLAEELRCAAPHGARAVCQRVLEAVESFAAGCDQYDDITLLAVKVG
ncbi:MAG: SpoIIE family protein phosphatase [candidate division KSB1 bacterium]|nr:SpoIIE family protein phosphatase [candidate division KSB1 bacterium]